MGGHHNPKLIDFVKKDVKATCGDEWLSKDRMNIIVAYTHVHGYIGFEGDLPWKRGLRGDANFVNIFIKLSPKIVLIMGRHTFESMPRKEGIKQIVLTRQTDLNYGGVTVLSDFEVARQYCAENGLIPVVFGGRRVYEAALRHPCRIFHTVVEEGDMPGDTTYPGHSTVIKTCFNITAKVNDLLLANNVKQTWSYENQYFTEKGIAYQFFVAEN